MYARHNAVDIAGPAARRHPVRAHRQQTLRERGQIRDVSTEALGDLKALEQRAEERLERAAIEPTHRRRTRGGVEVNPVNYLYLAALLFTIGATGVLIRRNAIVVFMCVELMLNACNLAFVTFSRMHGNLDGQIIAFFTMVVAAAEVVVGLAIIVSLFRSRHSASVDDASLMKL